MKQSDIDWKGGEVLWLEEDLDVSKSLDSQMGILREDLIAVKFGSRIFLDLSWLPEFDPKGQFVLSVVQSKNQNSQDWENPILQLKFRDLSQFMSNLTQAIEVASRSES